jgi:hypothetical protein
LTAYRALQQLAAAYSDHYKPMVKNSTTEVFIERQNNEEFRLWLYHSCKYMGNFIVEKSALREV